MKSKTTVLFKIPEGALSGSYTQVSRDMQGCAEQHCLQQENNVNNPMLSYRKMKKNTRPHRPYHWQKSSADLQLCGSVQMNLRNTLLTEKNNSCKNPYSMKPLIKWSKQANNILLHDAQACGKTTPKTKGIINTIVHIVDNAEKKA